MGYENELAGFAEEYWDDYEDMYVGEHEGECENAVDSSDYIERWYRDCDPEDGSSCEFVSTVEDYDTFVNCGAIEDMVDAITSNVTDVDSDESCGIHIHVDQNHFTTLHYYNAVKFMNTLEHDYLIYSVAGREDGRYHNRVFRRIDGSYPTCIDSKSVRVSRRNHLGTVEFRVFQATTNADTIKRSFQFVHAVTAFTDPEIFENSIDSFVEFVKNEDGYGILIRHLEEEFINAQKGGHYLPCN